MKRHVRAKGLCFEINIEFLVDVDRERVFGMGDGRWYGHENESI